MKEIINSTVLSLLIKSVIILLTTVISVYVVKIALNKDKLKNLIHIKFIKNIVIAIIWIIGITTFSSQFSSFNKLANTILAGSGILAAIIGLAAQESFSNIFSGLFISMFKPFNIGDRIKIAGDETAGFVEDITLRHTIIRTYMNIRLIIPNSIIGSAKIENSTYSKGASYPIDITISYENKDKRYRAMEIIEEVITSHPLFYDIRSDESKDHGDKATTCLCAKIATNGIELRALMWTESIIDNNIACSECRLQILDRFEAEKIEIPYNKIEIIN